MTGIIKYYTGGVESKIYVKFLMNPFFILIRFVVCIKGEDCVPVPNFPEL